MSSMIEASHVWKRYQIHELKTLYRRAGNWPRLVRELFQPSSRGNPNEGFWALRDVSLEMKPGEVLGIIGPNGAGKTTLLRLMAGITRPTRGYVKVKGRIGALISVGAGFHPELTGRENIYLNGAVMGMSKHEIDLKFDSIVDFAEVEDFLDTPLKRYSSGMAVRLGFSVAAHLEPDVLLIDEVLSVGDIRFRRKSLERMRQLFQSGVTIVFVSHNLRQIENLCERALLLENGECVMSGPSSDVVAHYINDTLKRLARENALRANGEVLEARSSVLVEGFELLNSEGKPVSELNFRDDGCLRLHFEALLPLEAFSFKIGIATLDDIPVFALPAPGFKRVPPGHFYLDCRLKSLPLLPGAYSLSIKVTASRTSYILPLGELNVAIRDYDSIKGQVPLNLLGRGICFIESQWGDLQYIGSDDTGLHIERVEAESVTIWGR